jgi:hypothetical protein
MCGWLCYLPSPESEWSCICVKGIDFASISRIVRLGFKLFLQCVIFVFHSISIKMDGEIPVDEISISHFTVIVSLKLNGMTTKDAVNIL